MAAASRAAAWVAPPPSVPPPCDGGPAEKPASTPQERPAVASRRRAGPPVDVPVSRSPRSRKQQSREESGAVSSAMGPLLADLNSSLQSVQMLADRPSVRDALGDIENEL